jgi:hypothetical protein
MRCSVLHVTRDLGHGLLADMPEDWDVRDEDGLIELEPPSRLGTAHISVLRRSAERPPHEGEAIALVEGFPAWREASVADALDEDPRGSELLALGSCVASDGALWHVGARVGHRRALVFSYNGETGADSEASKRLFFSIEGLDS